MPVPLKSSSSLETITTFFSESESDPSVEIERFRRKFKLMRAHFPSRVLGSSSPLDSRLTVLVAAIFSLSAVSVYQPCGTKVFESFHNCGTVADSFQNGKPEKTSL